jgi:hypothetical protein
MTHHKRSVLAALTVIASLLLSGETRALAAELTTCGQVLVDGGYLTADLDCSADTTDAPTVVLGAGGTLELRGFTITSRATSIQVATVQCTGRRCTILGPGTVVGGSGPLNEVFGFDSWEHANRLTVIDATITGGALGVAAPRVNIRNSIVSGNRNIGVWTGRANIVDSQITGNGTAGESAFGGLAGFAKARVARTEISGNGKVGVADGHLVLSDSTVVGNNVHADCATKVCVDVAARAKPVLVNSSCNTSLQAIDGVQANELQDASNDPATHNWDVCDLD